MYVETPIKINVTEKLVENGRESYHAWTALHGEYKKYEQVQTKSIQQLRDIEEAEKVTNSLSNRRAKGGAGDDDSFDMSALSSGDEKDLSQGAESAIGELGMALPRLEKEPSTPNVVEARLLKRIKEPKNEVEKAALDVQL